MNNLELTIKLANCLILPTSKLIKDPAKILTVSKNSNDLPTTLRWEVADTYTLKHTSVPNPIKVNSDINTIY